MKPFFQISVVFFISLFMMHAPTLFSAPHVRALWVECQGTHDTLDSKSKILELVETAAKNKFNLLYVQVFRGQKAWYKSTLVPNEPYQDFLKKENLDLLQFLIEEGHKRGLEVHAWANQLRVIRNAQNDYPVIERLGKEVVTCNGQGISLLDFPKEKLPDAGYWLDAGDEKVQRFLADLAEEIIRNYPELDGYHLDFIRIPFDVPYAGSRWDGGKGFGYGKRSVHRFQVKTGLNPMTMEKSRENTQIWDDWRRDQITEVVRTVSRRVKSINPKMQVSAAVMCWPDRAYLSSYQDWGGWLEEGIIDAVVTMNYSIDSRFVNRLSRQALALKQKSKVYIGLGSYLLEEHLKDFEKQIIETHSLNPDGVAFFSYDSMLKKPEMFQIVSRQFNSLLETSGKKLSLKSWTSPSKTSTIRVEKR